MSKLKRIVLSAAVAALPVVGVGVTTAFASPAHAAGCSTNYYYVDNAPAGVYEYPGGGWLKDKGYGDSVTGPNSNVMPNLDAGWRAVYTASAGDGVGWMWAPKLSYLGCS